MVVVVVVVVVVVGGVGVVAVAHSALSDSAETFHWLPTNHTSALPQIWDHISLAGGFASAPQPYR